MQPFNPADPITEAAPTANQAPEPAPTRPTTPGGFASYLLDCLTHGAGGDSDRAVNLILATRQFNAAMDQAYAEGVEAERTFHASTVGRDFTEEMPTPPPSPYRPAA